MFRLRPLVAAAGRPGGMANASPQLPDESRLEAIFRLINHPARTAEHELLLERLPARLILAPPEDALFHPGLSCRCPGCGQKSRRQSHTFVTQMVGGPLTARSSIEPAGTEMARPGLWNRIR